MQHYFDEVRDVAIQGYDESHRVIYWNRASEVLYGFSAEEALGERLEALIIPEPMRDRVSAEIDAWLHQGLLPSGGLLSLRRKDGSLVEVHSSHVITRDATGRPRMYCVDLLAHQRMALPSAFESGRGEESGAGMLNMYGCLSHEFRTPLNAAIGCAELLRSEWKQADDGDVPARLEMLALSTKRLLGVFDQTMFLLAWARGEIWPQPRFTSLDDILIEVLHDTSAAALALGAGVRLDQGGGGIRVWTDAVFLKQAVYAVVMSALSITAAGGSVGMEVRSHPDGREILVMVTDRGPRLDKAALSRILTGRESAVQGYDPREISNLLYLPMAHHAAVAVGAMFTSEAVEPEGNRSILAVPLVAR